VPTQGFGFRHTHARLLRDGRRCEGAAPEAGCPRGIVPHLSLAGWSLGGKTFSLTVVGDREVLGPDLIRWLITVSFGRPLEGVIKCA
jgi:hypothetical protein